MSYLGQSITSLTGCGERAFYAERERERQRQKKMRHETKREDEVLFAAD